MKQAKKAFREVGWIVIRNIFLPIHVIIAAVVVLLVVFGERQEPLFLGIILVINIVLGLVQEIRAWFVLSRLQLLAAPRALQIGSDEKEESVLVEELEVGDRVKLKLGDQVPCDGIVVSSTSFEINEALITGESSSFSKTEGGQVLAGSIVTSGSAVMRAEKTFDESRISLMTKSIRTYARNTSAIQDAINTFIKYMGILLVVSIAFIAIRGYLVGEAVTAIIRNVGAITSVLMPQGLLIATTAVFAFGATRLLRKNVLLQQVNATEKLGRIKNLCMDKTGTLTENTLVVEHIHVPEGMIVENAEELSMSYIKGSGDSSQTVRAVERFINVPAQHNTVEALSFSSAREYGAVHAKDGDECVILAGAPDIFLPHLKSEAEKAWLENLLHTNAHIGKRLFAVVRSDTLIVPHDLSSVRLSVLAVYVLNNNLREGIQNVVRFFQERGVAIRIISGDNPETVAAVAREAGVLHTDAVITGSEMEGWGQEDFDKRAKEFAIFARIKPEQKERIIQAMKRDGFTAMVGDGANDALAIKKADLGIATVDGAPATRNVADVVLMKNSFADLPVGVRNADVIIANLELFASVFFNQIFAAFLFFVIVSVAGSSFPFSPLTISWSTYFYIVLPGLLVFYWILRAPENKILRSDKSFLGRTVPLSLSLAVVQAIGMAVVFFVASYAMKNADPSTLAVVAFVILGFAFFAIAAKFYRNRLARKQIIQIALLAVIEIAIGIVAFQISGLLHFFDMKQISLSATLEASAIAIGFCVLEYGAWRVGFGRRETRRK